LIFFFVKLESFLQKGTEKILERKERLTTNIIKGNEYLSSYPTKKKIDKKVIIEKFKKRSKPSIKGTRLNLLNSKKLFLFLLSIFNQRF
tara:strand:+ start:912 stop:1178 length:267 start_codon:yes stop_codon:yes gene_type:complete